MLSPKLIKTTLAVAIGAGAVGFAPAAFATWGAAALVNAHCWRTVGTDNGEWGMNGTNYTTGGGAGTYHDMWGHAYLKRDGRDIDSKHKHDKGYLKIRQDRDGVTGGRHYKVDAYLQEGRNGNTATQKHDACYIT